MEENKCYVPMDISLTSDFFTGFGKKELMRTLLGIAIGLGISFIIYCISRQAITVVVSVAVFMTISVSLNIRDRVTNFSFVDEIMNIIRFQKMQKYYSYKYLPEWDFEPTCHQCQSATQSSSVQTAGLVQSGATYK